MKKLTIVLIILVFIVFASCKKQQEQVHETSTKYTCPMHSQIVQDKPGTCPICGMDLVRIDATGVDNGSVMLNESQIRLGNITTTLTRFQDIGSTTALNGKLTINEDETEVISSRVKGRIEKLYFKEIGQRIKQGEPLYKIYSEELLTLQQEYLLALQQYETLGQQERRYERFVKASEKKLRLFGLSENQIKKLAAQKSGESSVTFTAPATGVISRIDALEGQYVEEGSSLYRIEKLDRLWIEAELYSNETHLAYPGDSIKIRITGFENEPVNSKVTFISPEFRGGTQIMMLRAMVPNPEHRFLPGMHALVMLVDTEKKVITLPTDAVIRDAKGDHVWVRGNDGAFTPRRVLTGVDNADNVEIRYGLDENENVVITGAYLLYSELVLKKGGDPMADHRH